MTLAFAFLLALHGLIHLLGVAKAFGWAALPQLTQPISPVMGVVWLVAAVLFVASAVSCYLWPRGWWALAMIAIVVSLIAILPSWADAKLGGAVNVVVAVGALFGFMTYGPFSLRAEYDRDTERLVLIGAPASIVTEADLAPLPDVVQRYLRATGVVGHPRVRSFYVRTHGRIRDGRDARWMPFASEQYNVVDPPARLFYLTASMLGVPVQGYHRYTGTSASMRVKVAALVPVVTASGAEMTQSETVTLFNDMCLFAPATLVDPAIGWTLIDTHTVDATFTAAGHTIRARLRFNDADELTDFISDDRYRASSDGDAMERWRWSTPIAHYRAYGPARLAAAGEGRWHDAEGDYSYIELAIDDVQYNVGPR